MRAMLLVLVVIAAGVLWIGGETHRRNCIQTHKVHCSVLPWENGSGSHSPGVGGYGTGR